MASVFTFDPDHPRVASPWLDSPDGEFDRDSSHWAPYVPSHVRLKPEPQTGPVEYKLHLLLGPRRLYASLDRCDPDRPHPRIPTPVIASARLSRPPEDWHTPILSPPTPQARQHRLEQLTTQLLWRLQQSSAHHTNSTAHVILPTLSRNLDAPQTESLSSAQLPDLSGSQGALYEIGVADDGTLVGLTEDEMRESLDNLRAMSTCLGCETRVTRRNTVGRAEWLQADDDEAASPTRMTSRLLVAEVLVQPSLSAPTTKSSSRHMTPRVNSASTNASESIQLRVSLTGATLSGKSSLLGTLTTSTMDNAKGKSRLSLLRHRHEISTGVTSSIAQEIIGYRRNVDDRVDILNYATENVESWTDIHLAAQGGRVVFLSDSAGHPRYRRTTVKSLVGWSPHWTLLCVSAKSQESTPPSPVTPDHRRMSDAAPDAFERAAISAGIVDLCLRLQLPLLIVVTKLDIASKAGLRTTLTQLLSQLKAAHRRPVILSRDARQSSTDTVALTRSDLDEITNITHSPDFDPFTTVPIVMTSAVDGTGMALLHSLLYKLPVPSKAKDDDSHATRGQSLFHVEDVYSNTSGGHQVVVAGLLDRGVVTLGKSLYLGPFSRLDHDLGPHPCLDEASELSERNSPSEGPVSWLPVQIRSLRDLRLPVNELRQDQVGTIGLQIDASENITRRIRKGMVLLEHVGQESRSFSARFDRDDLGVLAVGSQVVVYIASIRASARVFGASIPVEKSNARDGNVEIGAEVKQQDDRSESVSGNITHAELDVTFHFDNGSEYIEVGSKVLVMPGGGPGVYHTSNGNASVDTGINMEGRERGFAGLEGFVGCICKVG